jgi:RHS repeat-associated protein
MNYSVRDNIGNPKTVIDSSGTTGYLYDYNNRLSQATYPGENPVNFAYDWVGNRGLSTDYNVVDQYKAGTGNIYDLAGNLMYTPDSSSYPRVGYSYTPNNLLSQVIRKPNDQTTQTITMTWDAAGRRVGLDFDGPISSSYSFAYDPTAGIPAVVSEDDGTTAVYYYREPSGALIARKSGSDWKYYHFDELGSTRVLTDGDGEKTDTYKYDAWGNVDHTFGTTEQPYQYCGEWGYYTHYQDANFKLLQLGVRFYDPEIGRFTQRDPVRHMSGAYVYSGANPVTRIDPLGMSWIVPMLPIFPNITPNEILDLFKPLPDRFDDCKKQCMADGAVGSKVDSDPTFCHIRADELLLEYKLLYPYRAKYEACQMYCKEKTTWSYSRFVDWYEYFKTYQCVVLIAQYDSSQKAMEQWRRAHDPNFMFKSNNDFKP